MAETDQRYDIYGLLARGEAREVAEREDEQSSFVDAWLDPLTAP